MVWSISFRTSSLLFFLFCSLTMSLPVSAAMEPRFELDAKALGVIETTKKQPAERKPSSGKARRGKSSRTGAVDGAVHIVRSGDNLFKILMRDYGFNNDEAETLIKVICRENNIADIRRLKIGQKIVIPSLRRIADKKNRQTKQLPAEIVTQEERGIRLGLDSRAAVFTELEANVQFRRVWDKIVPPHAGRQSPDMISSPSFSLTLDPQRYPTYATMDGGRILVDRDDLIPPLVKNLIVEKNPSVRIVSESPVNGKLFLNEMLDSAGFYSVVKDYSLDYGSDPKLTIYSDFKIEKTSESIINFDSILLNSGRTPYPRVIKDFLKSEGLTAFEPFASLSPAVGANSSRLYQITSRNQADMVDGMLASMSINPDRNKRLDVFAEDDNGISLAVKAERYFERGGKKHIITRFDGDPLTYTLFRILETKGYQTVILDVKDDFRTITEKLLSIMRIQGSYALYKLGLDAGANYSLQMSGFRLGDANVHSEEVFLTNLEFDHVIRDLLLESGYSITVK